MNHIESVPAAKIKLTYNMASIKQVILSWDDVLEMAPSIKQVVEQSVWTLFQVSGELKSAKYLLDTLDKRYFLESSGSVIRIVESTDVFEIHERVFFVGLIMKA